MPDDIVLISDPRILAIPIHDNGEPLVDLADFPDIALSTKRKLLYPGFSKVRETLAQKLYEARKDLPRGWRFLFEEGYRPLSLQKRWFDDYCAKLRTLHPHMDDTQLHQEATKYVAPPDNVPPHSTGGAIDVTLLDENENEVDMGSTSDDTPDKNGDANYTFSRNITTGQATNRKILVEVMTQAGFVNYPTEWWHWSYGDRYWALDQGAIATGIIHSVFRFTQG